MHLENFIQTGGDTSVYNKFDYDVIEQREAELLQKALSLEAANAPPEIDIPKNIETPQKKQLRRDIEAAALERLDANRERRERYREICRNNEEYPLEYGEAAWGMVFPKNLNTVLEKQIRKGEFLDAIFYSPYEIQELVTDGYLYDILKNLKNEHKELLYLIAVKGLSTAKIADLQGKTDRAVRAMRKTVLNKIRRKAYEYLTSQHGRKHDMTLAEKRFAENYKTE